MSITRAADVAIPVMMTRRVFRRCMAAELRNRRRGDEGKKKSMTLLREKRWGEMMEELGLLMLRLERVSIRLPSLDGNPLSPTGRLFARLVVLHAWTSILVI